jgi:hypothetical protein
MEVEGKLLANGLLMLYFAQLDSVLLELAEFHPGLFHALPGGYYFFLLLLHLDFSFLLEHLIDLRR